MRGKRLRWSWRDTARVAILASLFAWPLSTACSGSSSPPAGSGDDVINDTRDAEVRAPANPTPDDAGPDAPSANPYEDGGYEGGGVTYPGLAECGNCTCSADEHFCFGGASAYDLQRFHGGPLASSDAGGDAGLPACTVVPDASAPTLGCNNLPAGCTD